MDVLAKVIGVKLGTRRQGRRGIELLDRETEGLRELLGEARDQRAAARQEDAGRLPTSGTARFSSPLGVYDFQKRSSLIEVSQAGAQTLGLIAAELAYGEGLQAHARAAELRLNQVPPMREAK